MTDYQERECNECNCLPLPRCQKCHTGLLARYRGSQAALTRVLSELREAREQIDSMEMERSEKE